MFIYDKKLQFPVKIKSTNPALAKIIISQYGGPDFNRLRLRFQGNQLSLQIKKKIVIYESETSAA